MLQPSQDFFDKSYREGPQYGRILAFNERGAAFLKEIKGSFPIITKAAQDKKILSPLGQAQLDLDIRANDIQASVFAALPAEKGTATITRRRAISPRRIAKGNIDLFLSIYLFYSPKSAIISTVFFIFP